MSLLTIRLWPDPVLSTPCARVDGDDVRALADDMLETMYAAAGRGLAAPQVGMALRLFVMDATWKEGARDPKVCINPQILTMAPGRVAGPEACLSLPGIETKVRRAPWIVLSWQDRDGRQTVQRLSGAAAVIAQHENDHLDGVVTLDHLDMATRARAEAEYGG